MSFDVPNLVAPGTPIDLTNCDREPIHIPGAVQPHGVLLALREDAQLTVVMASESTLEHLGRLASELREQPLASVIGARGAEGVRNLIGLDTGRHFNTMELELPARATQRMDVTVHRSGGLLLLELEPAADDGDLRTDRMNAIMRSTVDRLESADSLGDLAQGVAQEMREVTGFDRVWVYRFHEDWHGEIIGEAKRDDIETWLGMHYPASDIPAQARALFLRNWLRVIPDIAFVPSPIVPNRNPLDGEPLDLGGSVLRSVSPIHVQYLTNMGVTASLVISLIHRGRLWGLISGHHYSGPRVVPYSTRVLCEFLAQALSLQIGAVDRLTDRERALEIRTRQSQLVERMGMERSLEQVLTAGLPNMATLVDADGGAIVRGDDVTSVGRTPTDDQVRALRDWLRSRGEEEFATSALGRDFPQAAAYADVASGLLALPISHNRVDQLLWFRAEQRQMVRWAGDPRKPVTIEDGTARLHPRGSFSLWEEEVRGTALPWLPVARDAAREIRRATLDLLIHRAEEIARLNEELMVSNAQLEESAVELEVQTQELLEQRELREEALDSERRARSEAEGANRAKADFLAIMSHELRTPLNAIGGYAQLMSLGMRGPTTPEQLSDLDRIQINQRHLLGLINSILNFTKLETGAIQFRIVDVAISPVLLSLDALVGPQMRAKHLTFSVGTCDVSIVVRADEEKLRQILLNLLTNALKFTPEGGTVEMDCHARGGVAEIRVMDTGIGIEKASAEAIFEPFVQINRNLTKEQDQGVGLGLAISRELARGMGGELTVSSDVGKGSTFFLTLPVAQ